MPKGTDLLDGSSKHCGNDVRDLDCTCAHRAVVRAVGVLTAEGISDLNAAQRDVQTYDWGRLMGFRDVCSTERKGAQVWGSFA